MNANELKVLEDALEVIETLQAEIEALKSENKFFKDLMGDVEILRKRVRNERK